MRARGWVTGVVLAWCATAAAQPKPAANEPKPAAVDIKAFRDALLVFQDATGGTYVVDPGREAGHEARVFYGTAKQLYAQHVVGRSRDGDAWGVQTWAPRIAGIKPASVERRLDGSFRRWCDGKDDAGLTQVTGDKAKAILDKYQFLTESLVRRAHLLARDDSGVYYYVDRLTVQFGGKGFRVFVGKKGAMKQLALTDVASDAAGEVFSTKTGDLRLTRTNETGIQSSAVWIKGEKRNPLVSLDTDANSSVIFTDLGIYKFLGTLCENN